jgi:hypothetical protein
MTSTGLSLAANAGGPYRCLLGESLTLDGSASRGPADMTYQWTVTPTNRAAGGYALLQNPKAASTKVMLSTAGDYRVKLDVSSGGQTQSSEASLLAESRLEPPFSSDDKWWSDRFLESRRTALASVKKSAERWEGILATILGIVGTVAFVSAPTTLDTLPPGRAAATVVIVVFAFALALAGLICVAAAGHGTPKETKHPIDYRVFMSDTQREFNRALGNLRNARVLILLAVLSLAIGTLIAWSAALIKSGESETTSAMVRAGGQLFCGELEPATAGEPLTLSGEAVSKVEEVTLVDGCPSSPTQTQSWYDANAAALGGAGLAVGLIFAGTIGWYCYRRLDTLRGLLLLVLFASVGIVLAAGPGSIGDETLDSRVIIGAACAVGFLGVALHILLNRVVRAL